MSDVLNPQQFVNPLTIPGHSEGDDWVGGTNVSLQRRLVDAGAAWSGKRECLSCGKTTTHDSRVTLMGAAVAHTCNRCKTTVTVR